MAYNLYNNQPTLAANSGGQMSYKAVPKPVIPEQRTRAKSISWDAVVRQAEGNAYQARLPYPVWQFGSGRVRRIFIEYV